MNGGWDDPQGLGGIIILLVSLAAVALAEWLGEKWRGHHG